MSPLPVNAWSRIGLGAVKGEPAMERVSVVIPHFGDPAPTLGLIQQLAVQTGPALQIVVVDDHSPELFPDVEGVTVIRRSRNGGFGTAVNTGAQKAAGELLLILNSDLHVGPTFVRDLVVAARPWQPCVAGPALRDNSGCLVHSARRLPRTSHQVVEWLTPLARFRPMLREQVGHDTRATEGSITLTDWVVGASLLVPTEEFAAVGGFDERFYMNAEEIDLQRRLRERGVPAIFVGTVSAVHVGHGSSDSARRRAWLVDARLAYAAKWGGRRRLQVGLAAATAANLSVNVLRRAAGRDVAPLQVARTEWSLLRGSGGDPR